MCTNVFFSPLFYHYFPIFRHICYIKSKNNNVIRGLGPCGLNPSKCFFLNFPYNALQFILSTTHIYLKLQESLSKESTFLPLRVNCMQLQNAKVQCTMCNAQCTASKYKHYINATQTSNTLLESSLQGESLLTPLK